MQSTGVELNEYYSNPFAKNEHKYSNDHDEDDDDVVDNESEYEEGNYIVSNKLHNDDDIDDACYAEIDLEENEHDNQSQINRESNELTHKTQIELSADNAPTSHLPTNWQHDESDNKRVSTRVSHESSIIARFKAALDEEVANASAMRDEYEKHIELLRNKVEKLTGENDHLQSTCMKLEGQLRALSLEKDNAEWVQEQQSNRTNALESRVEELEHELEQTQIRARKMVHEIEMTYKTQQQRQRPPSRQAEAAERLSDKCHEVREGANEMSLTCIQQLKQTGDTKNKDYNHDETKTIRLSNERSSSVSVNGVEINKLEMPKEIQQYPAENFTNKRSSNTATLSDSSYINNNITTRSTDRSANTNLRIRKDNDEGAKEDKESTAISKAAVQRRRASTPPWLPASDRSKEKEDNKEINTVRVSRRGLNPDKTAWMTDDEKEQQRARERVVVEQLEAELLDHSKQRDELVSQLQRLESSRLKTVAERAKKAAVENDLNTEEHAIGKLRLQLRSYSSLIK